MEEISSHHHGGEENHIISYFVISSNTRSSAKRKKDIITFIFLTLGASGKSLQCWRCGCQLCVIVVALITIDVGVFFKMVK
jgi:hypothetical protein